MKMDSCSKNDQNEAIRRSKFYAHSDFVMQNLIYLQEIGNLELPSQQVWENQIDKSYLFGIVTAGSGKLEYAGDVYRLSPGYILFLDCENRYTFYSQDTTLKIKYVCFYGFNVSGIYQYYLEQARQCCFLTEKQESYINCLNEISEIIISPVGMCDILMYGKLVNLLILILKMVDQEEEQPQPNNVLKKQNLQNIKKYLDEHYEEKISLDDLSELFGVNKFYLTRIFREQFDISVNDYLTQVRIMHAKQMLDFTDLSVQKIAQKCGISNSNYFCRLFKAWEGVSPGEYRKNGLSEDNR